jgi:hypothetical protein
VFENEQPFNQSDACIFNFDYDLIWFIITYGIGCTTSSSSCILIYYIYVQLEIIDRLVTLFFKYKLKKLTTKKRNQNFKQNRNGGVGVIVVVGR